MRTAPDPVAETDQVPERLTATELGRLIGLGRPRVYKHIARAGIEPDAAKRYSVEDFLLAVQTHRAQDKRLENPTTPKTEKVRLESELLRLKLAQVEGSLLPIDDVRRTWSDLIAAFRSRILAIPRKLATQLAPMRSPSAVEALLRGSLYEALDELSRTPVAPRRRTREPDPRPGRTSPDPNRRRMVGRRADPKPRGKRRAGTLED